MKNYSVLMAVYKNDNCEFLIQAIDSMLMQTVQPEQIVIVVDGPIDEQMSEVILNYKKQFCRIFTILELAENGGLANALNKGISVCRNNLIARMDADDISDVNRCELELERFSNNSDLCVCGCNIREFYYSTDDTKLSRCVPDNYEDIKKFAKRRQPFNHPTVMYRKDKVLAVGGYPNIKRKEDFDLFSKMIVEGYYMENINKSLYFYRANEANYSRRKSKLNLLSALYVYKRHYKRGGCGLVDFLCICAGEILFFLLPNRVMKLVSDKLLRSRE